MVLSIYLVGKQAWRCFGGIIRREVGVFHPCIAMPNLQGLPPFPERKNCFRQVRGADTRDRLEMFRTGEYVAGSTDPQSLKASYLSASNSGPKVGE